MTTNPNLPASAHLKAAKCSAGAEVYRWFKKCIAKKPETTDANEIKAICDALKSLSGAVGKMVMDGEEEKEKETSLEDLTKQIEDDVK